MTNKTGSAAELVQRRLDTVDLIVQGASLRAIAKKHSLSVERVRDDYFAGLKMVTDRSIQATIALRDEITLRQKALILANMPAALAGEKGAAMIVQRCDELLTSIWGLRSLRVELPDLPRDPAIAEALTAYLTGVADQIRQ